MIPSVNLKNESPQIQLKKPIKKTCFLSSRKILLFLVFILFFLFFQNDKAEAANGVCQSTWKFKQAFTGKEVTNISSYANITTKEACESQKANLSGQTFQWVTQEQFTENKKQDNVAEATPTTQRALAQAAAEKKAAEQDLCKIKIWDLGITAILNCILLYILQFVGWLLTLAVSLFAWLVDAEKMRAILSNAAIFTVWKFIRDFFNVFFILVLVFSAFCTIFQVSKYNYKKILFMLILMALLVNFSYPISRVIIDFSNVTMYSIFKSKELFGNNGGGSCSSIKIENNATATVAKIACNSSIDKIISPTNNSSVKAKDLSTINLIASVIFVFLLMITILAMAVLLLIRVIALAIVIIFSSIGFVGYIIPSLEKYAGQWWDNLFKYAFFGPIMAFMLAIAIKLMDAMSDFQNSFKTIAQQNSPDPDIVTQMGQAILPIVILWMGMAVAQKMGIEGAGKVMDKAKKWGASFAKSPLKLGAWGFKQTGIPGGMKQKWDQYKKEGMFFGSNVREGREARWAERGPISVHGATDKHNAKMTKEAGDRHDVANMTENGLIAMSQNGNQYERAAAMMQLASTGSAQRDAGTNLAYIRDAFGPNSQLARQMQTKVQSFDPVTAFTNAAGGLDEAGLADFINSGKMDIKKLGTNSLGTTRFMEMMFENSAINAKKLGEIRTEANGSFIDSSLRTLAGSRANRASAIDRSIHLSHLAQTGDIANNVMADLVFQDMDKDTAKKLTIGTVTRHAATIQRNAKANQYSSVIQNMTDRNAASYLNRYIQTNAGGRGTNERSLNRIATTDPKIQHIH